MVYDPPRFMSIQEALQQLVAIEDEKQAGWCTRGSLAIGLMRVGSKTQTILAGTIGELLALPAEIFGAPLHSLILPGSNLHDLEHEMMHHYAVPGSSILH
jgi:diphthine synthase